MSISSVRQSQKEAAIREILAVSERIWLSEGCQAISMKAIAKQAGIAVGTLYNYFADKEALMQELVRVKRSELFTGLSEASAPFANEPFEVRLTQLLGLIFPGSMDSHKSKQMMIVTAESPVSAKQNAPNSLMREFSVWMRPLVKAGIDEGVLAPRDLTQMTMILVSLIRAVAEELHEGHLGVCEAIELVKSSYLDGHRRR